MCDGKLCEAWPPRILLERCQWSVMKLKRAIQSQLILQDLHRWKKRFLPANPARQVLICEGTIVCVRKGSQPQIQPSPFCQDSMRTCMLLRTRSDGYLFCARYSIALSIVELTTTTAQLKTTSILSSVANYKKEDDTIFLDDVYCCFLVDPRQWWH